MKIQNSKIAFISKFAPSVNSKYPMATEKEDGIYAQYHFDIYEILSNISSSITTANDAEFIINNHDKIEYVFSLLNRAPYRNSEVFISALCEYYGIPYLGSRPNIRALAEDKHLAKILSKSCNVKTAKWIFLNCNSLIPNEIPFNGPYFVKPRFGASSAFIDEKSICHTISEVQERTKELYNQGVDVLIEEFISGVFYSSPVIEINNEIICLPIIKEVSMLKGNVVTYKQKRKLQDGLFRSVENDEHINNILRKHSKALSNHITPFDYARFDYMVTAEGVPYFLEFNLCCNLGKQSAFMISANSIGISQNELVKEILTSSMKRQGII